MCGVPPATTINLPNIGQYFLERMRERKKGKKGAEIIQSANHQWESGQTN
jgi:formylmethanofuran dehydrogenase subunit C